MTTNFHHPTAKIYEFPVRGRFKGVVRPNESMSTPNLASPRAEVVFGGSWYHEEAVQEERARKELASPAPFSRG